MENEELFAGEPALDAQQRAQDMATSAATKNAPLHVHTEPLLAGDDENEEEYAFPRDDESSDEVDNRPRWRRPHVSDDHR